MLPGGLLCLAAAAVLIAGGAGGAASTAAAACAPAQHPLIAEVLYDAVGDDAGWVFVELYSLGPSEKASSRRPPRA